MKTNSGRTGLAAGSLVVLAMFAGCGKVTVELPGSVDVEPPGSVDVEPPGSEDAEPSGSEPPGSEDVKPPGPEDVDSSGSLNSEPPGPVDGEPESCVDSTQVSFYAPSGMDADWLLPVDGERFIAVGAPANGGVAELDEAGNVVWSSTPLPGGFLKTGAKTEDGGLMVAGQVNDSTSPSGEGLWLGRLDGAGQLLESRQLGPSTFSVHVDIELLPHPTGGYVLSTHDSEAEGAAPRLRLVRLDDAGEIVHERFMPLAPGSAMPESWSRGGAALLPGGDVVQLTAHAGYLRVVRSTEQTAPVFDRVLEEVGEAWPQDIAALPDGRIAIVAISVGQSHVILLDADGTVIWARTYHPELDTELNAIAHDPSTGLLHLGGATRGADGGTLRTWLISVDTDGELRWEYEGDVGTPARINGVTSLPGGGFVATGFGDFVYAVVRPQACP